MTILGAIPLDMDNVVLNLFDASNGASIVAAVGRSGGNVLRVSSGGVEAQKTLPSALNSVNIAFGYKPASLPNGQFSAVFDAGSYQCAFAMLSDGTVQGYRGNSSVLLASSSVGTLVAGVYQHIEYSVVISATIGSMQLWVNSISVFSGSNLNTKSTANTTVSQFQLIAPGSAAHDFCDVIYSTSRIGDRRVECLMPTGSGFYTQFTASGSNANWQNVKETPSDGDTSYNNTLTSGSIDTFSHATMSAAPLSIDAVIVNVRARNTTTGAGNIAPVIRNGGVDVSGSDTAINTSYQSLQLVYPLDPATSSSWLNAAAVNSAQIGYKKTV